MTAPRFCVLDLEYTHPEPTDAHIIEWAAVVYEPEFFGAGGMRAPVGGLVRPPIAIPPETSAVHHIIDADVIGAPPWGDVQPIVQYHLEQPGTILVAHGAENDAAVLTRHGVTLPPILCTYKAALRAWPEAPRHGNEALRYWLGHGTGRGAPQAPHTAAHDAQVTALILRDLLKVATLEDMLKWTLEPALLPRCPIGDWRGHPWPEVDESFLHWILRKIEDRPDLRFCAETELRRRDAEREADLRAEEAARRARAALAGASTDHLDEDIPF